MDHRRQIPVRIAERIQKPKHPIKGQVDDFRVQCHHPFKDGVASGIGRCCHGIGPLPGYRIRGLGQLFRNGLDRALGRRWRVGFGFFGGGQIALDRRRLFQQQTQDRG